MAIQTTPHMNTNRFIEKAKEIKSEMFNKRAQYHPVTPDNYEKKLKEFIIGLVEYSSAQPEKKIDIISNINSVDSSTGRKVTELTMMYKIKSQELDKLYSEDEQIKRLEINAHFRNIIARALTTLAIGFGIMIVYWVAHKVGIPMPMLRIPA